MKCWYIDGSLLNARLPICAAAGGAAVVVSHDGQLVAVAQVAMPSNVRTAAAAEVKQSAETEGETKENSEATSMSQMHAPYGRAR